MENLSVSLKTLESIQLYIDMINGWQRLATDYVMDNNQPIRPIGFQGLSEDPNYGATAGTWKTWILHNLFTKTFICHYQLILWNSFSVLYLYSNSEVSKMWKLFCADSNFQTLFLIIFQTNSEPQYLSAL